MRKIILLAALAASVTLCRSQSIVYSNYSIKAATSSYKIIGKVGRNIIVWTCIDKYYSSEILIYDNKLNLIKKVASDILKSDINPSPIFFNKDDSFCVAYQYNKNKHWQYKIASFNEKGNLSSEKILDSIQSFNSAKDTTYYNYKFLQSADKKTICFTKFIYDKNNYVLKFDCSFFTNDKTFHKYFVLPFDDNHDWFADFLIDNNKNFFFVIHHQTDSISQVKIIKKSFYDDYMLVEQRDVAKVFLQKQSLRILNAANSYIVCGFGKPENYSVDSLNKSEGAFYLWRVDSGLNKNPGDSIYNNFNTENFNEVRNDVIVSTDGNHVIVVQNKVEDINQQPLQDNYIPSSLKEPSPSLLQQPYSASTPIGDRLGGMAASTPSIDASNNDLYYNPNIISKVVLFNIDKFNRTEWTKDFTMSSQGISSNIILNGIIIVNNDKIHLIYPVTIRKKTLIKHIVISYNGTEKEQNEIAWRASNSFIISQGLQVDENAIVFPMLKNNKLNFVRMSLE